MKGINAADIRKLCAEKKQKQNASIEKPEQEPTKEEVKLTNDSYNLDEKMNEFLQKPLVPLKVNRYGPLEYCHLSENFISPEEENLLINFIISSDRWVGTLGVGTRRHQNWGGLPGKRDIAEDLPKVFIRLIDRMMISNIFPEHQRPNHVLINEYKDGCGLIPHDDGPLYEPVVAVISLGSAILNYWEMSSNGKGDPIGSLFLKSGGCHVTSHDLYFNYLHGILTTKEDCVPNCCWNLNSDDIIIGKTYERPQTRYSIVFVHKIQEK